MAQRPFGNSTK